MFNKITNAVPLFGSLFVIAVGAKYLVDAFLFSKTENMETGSDPMTEVDDDNLIPKIIIQSWKTFKTPYNNKYKQLQNNLRAQNPEYEYNFFLDDEIDKFIETEYPNYYGTFTRLPVNIQKMDFFRYIALYHFGGFYFDLDVESLTPLEDILLKHKNVFPVDNEFRNSKDLNRTWIQVGNDKILLGQYAFGTQKNSAFMKALVDNIHNNIESIITAFKDNVKNNISNYEYFVYKTTGPDYVSYIYDNYEHKDEVFILKSKRQNFGTYARHRFFGTWKNNTNN